MAHHIYSIDSSFELEFDNVNQFFQEYELPDGVADIEFKQRNNTLLIAAVPDNGTVPEYTPTAQLKGVIEERLLYKTPDGWSREPNQAGEGDGDSRWSNYNNNAAARTEPDEDMDTKVVEIVSFKGDGENVLQNSALRYEMFQVLQDLATSGEGTFTAVYGVDGDLKVTHIVDGEERPATIEINIGSEKEPSNTGNWRNNRFIKD